MSAEVSEVKPAGDQAGKNKDGTQKNTRRSDGKVKKKKCDSGCCEQQQRRQNQQIAKERKKKELPDVMSVMFSKPSDGSWHRKTLTEVTGFAIIVTQCGAKRKPEWDSSKDLTNHNSLADAQNR